MIKKIYFVNPPYFSFRGSHNNRPNIGMANLAAILDAAGQTVKIINLDAKPGHSYITRYDIFKNADQSQNWQLSAEQSSLVASIVADAPDIVFVSAGDMTIPSTDLGSNKHAVWTAERLREAGYRGKLFGFGPDIRSATIFDTVIFGDFEHMVVDVVERDLLGQIYADCPEDFLDKIPFFSTKNFHYELEPRDIDYIWSSRGCSNKCKFCVMSKFFHNRIKRRSAKRFVDEVEHRKNTYGTQDFYVTDMDFNADQNKAKEICEELIVRNLNVSWRCESRIDTITAEMAGLMKRAGCKYVKLGVEAMNDNRLRLFNKGITVEMIKQRMSELAGTGIGRVVYILLGGHGFVNDDYKKEFEAFAALGAEKYTVSVLNPHYLSDLYRELDWAATQIESGDHLNGEILTRYWNISEEVANLFFSLELGRGREDGTVRNYFQSQGAPTANDKNALFLVTDFEKKQRQQFIEMFKHAPMSDVDVLLNLGLFIKRQDLMRIFMIDELYKKILPVHGSIFEFGTRWGQNMALFQSLRGIYEPYNHNRKIVGFDTFCGFPSVHSKDGQSTAVHAGAYTTTEHYEEYLTKILEYHEKESPISHLRKFELVKGDASVKIKEYLANNPETIIAMAYFDLDIYQPTRDCLAAIKPHLTRGSVIGFDELNHHHFPGETLALQEVLGLGRYKIRRGRYSSVQSYFIVD